MPKKRKPFVAPKQRAPRGEGSVFPDARRGGWVGKVPVGRYPGGSTKYVEVRGATKDEVVKKKKAVQPPDPNTVTVSEWAERWLAGLDVRPSTRQGYEKQVRARIIPSLGMVRVGALVASDVRAALQKWASSGTATANRTRAVGATMFAAAVLDGIVARNPFADCKRLKYDPKELDPFAPDELRQVIAAQGARYTAAPLLAFLAATGTRIGEAAALDVSDYDPARGRISIARTWSIAHGARAPKSRHSRRTITVPVPARPAVLAAIGSRTTGPLFLSRGRSRFNSAQIHIALNRLLKSLGLRKRNPHALRHGVATLLVSRGVPLGDVARFLGHTVAQVVRTYVHATGTDPAETLSESLA